MSISSKSPEIKVVFGGFKHYELNYQGGKRLVDAFGRIMVKGGENWVHHENAGFSLQEANDESIKFNRHGFAGLLLSKARRQEMGWGLTERQAEAEVKKIEALGLRRVLERGLVPLGALSSFYLGLGLDGLRRDRQLRIRIEGLEGGLLIESRILDKEAYINGKRTDALLEDRQVSLAMESEEKALAAYVKLASVRHKGIIPEVRGLANKMFQNNRSGAIALAYGETHEFIVGQMKADGAFPEGVEFVTCTTKQPSWKQALVDAGLSEASPNLNDTLLASTLVAVTATRILINEAMKRRLVLRFVEGFEDFLASVDSLVEATDLSDLIDFLSSKDRAAHPIYNKVTQLLIN